MEKVRFKFSRGSPDRVWRHQDFLFGFEGERWSSSSIAQFRVVSGHLDSGPFRNHFQFESRALAKLSRWEAIWVASLHVRWLLRVNGKNCKMEIETFDDEKTIYRLSTTVDRTMKAPVLATNCKGRTARVKWRKATREHCKQRQLRS